MNTCISDKKAPKGKVLLPGGFKSAYLKMPHESIKQVRDEISELCYWGYSTFRSKINGCRYFTVFEMEIITKYFAEKGIDAWSGEPINE